jgi:hypothetical protein
MDDRGIVADSGGSGGAALPIQQCFGRHQDLGLMEHLAAVPALGRLLPSLTSLELRGEIMYVAIPAVAWQMQLGSPIEHLGTGGNTPRGGLKVLDRLTEMQHVNLQAGQHCLNTALDTISHPL